MGTVEPARVEGFIGTLLLTVRDNPTVPEENLRGPHAPNSKGVL